MLVDPFYHWYCCVSPFATASGFKAQEELVVAPGMFGLLVLPSAKATLAQVCPKCIRTDGSIITTTC
jgi:hypothetical protein